VALDFLAVGDVMLDVHVPAPGDAPLHAPVRVAAGGSAVNAALAAAGLGAHAAVAGCVGDDIAGRTIREELETHGVRPLLQVAPGATGTTVYVGTGVVADRGANASFAVDGLPEATVTLASGFLSAGQLAGVLKTAAGLRAVDLQGRPHELPHVDVVLGPRLDLDAHDAEVVCSTLGPDGAVARRGDETAEARPPRVLEEAPPGTGDRFAAAFLLALAAGLPLQDCVERGCAAAVADG
jgi:sugar/nucleoside kinase (ribokinase family)